VPIADDDEKNPKEARCSGLTKFSFDRVFGPSASQEQVFEDIELLVQSALNGRNVCIFAYGQTGSGKSFTMEGPPKIKRDASFYREHPKRGIIPRAVTKIFDEMPEFEKSGWTYTLKCGFLEVYQEKIYDLLSKAGDDDKELLMAGDDVKGLTLESVSSVEQVDALMCIAKKRRRIGATEMNAQSSRSHFLFQLVIEGSHINGSRCRGRLNLVDLAGSERYEAGKHDKQREEGTSIRKSLGALSTVLVQLRQNPKNAVYRSSKLTRLLKNDLSAGSKVLVMINVAPEESSLTETRSSLIFGKSAGDVKVVHAKKE
jgi:kinesin family protein C1